MAKIDLKSLSVQELTKLHKNVEQEMADRDKRQRKEALNAVKEKAKQLGFSLDELMGTSANGASRPARRAAPPKYRNPSDPNLTWSGRGRPPRWIKEEQEKGVDLESMRIDGDN